MPSMFAVASALCLLVVIVCQFWMIGLIWSLNPVYALVALSLPVLVWVFAFRHWEIAKRPMVVQIGFGILSLLLAAMIE